MSKTIPMWVIRVYSDKENNQFEDIEFTPGKFLLAEAVAIEERANLTWPQVITGVGMWRASAIQAVIWILRKRSNPKLKYSDIVLSIEQIEVLDPDDMPEYGATTPGELEPEVALEPEVQDTPKDQSSNGPEAPLPTTPVSPEA